MPGRPVPTMCVGVGAPPYCFVLAVYFMRATNGRPYKSNKTLSMPVGEDSISSRNVVRIYQKPSPVGEGGSRRLTDEVSVSLFALPFGGALTNENHLNPCRDRRPRLSVSLFALSFGGAQTNGSLSISVGEGLAPPVLCSHYPLAEKKYTVSLYLGRGRRLRRPEKTLIYNGLSRAPAPTAF